MTTTARRRKNQTSPVSRPMADISQVWVPWPECWPVPSAEAMAEDARRRARYLAGSKFWSKPTLSSRLDNSPLVQKGLFDG